MNRWWQRRKRNPESTDVLLLSESTPVAEVPIEPSPEEVLLERIELATEDLMRRIDDLALALDHLRFEFDERLPAPIELYEFDEEAESPDEEYALYLQYFVRDGKISRLSGEILELQIIGQLRDGSFVWVNESRRVCGVVTLQELGDRVPFPDDRFRARIVSYPWGHVIEAVAPNSLRGPLERKRTITPSPDWGRAAIAPLLEGQAPWLRQLKPGDVIKAHISYEGPLPIDRKGRLAKVRPAVFIRWEDDYAVVRACYDKNSFVGERDLGDRAVDSNCFKKSTVIRRAEFDVRIEHLRSKIGRLGSRDLKTLNIDDIQETDSEPVSATVVRPTIQSAPLISDSESITKLITRDVLDNVVVITANRVKSGDHSQMAQVFLDVLIEREDSRELLITNGVLFAVAGECLQRIAKSNGSKIPPGKFGLIMRDVVQHFDSTSRWRPFIDYDQNGHEVLRCEVQNTGSVGGHMTSLTEPEPIDRDRDWGPDSYARFKLPADFSEPDLIVMDQESSAFILGDSRVNLRSELESLRFGGKARAVIVGSDEVPARKSFVIAAKNHGWDFEYSDPTNLIATIAALARKSNAHCLALITRNTELVAELENNGVDVLLVCEVDDE